MQKRATRRIMIATRRRPWALGQRKTRQDQGNHDSTFDPIYGIRWKLRSDLQHQLSATVASATAQDL
jgi:hypothetical protein